MHFHMHFGKDMHIMRISAYINMQIMRILKIYVHMRKTPWNQAWNLSKNLHDPIFGQKNFTHKKHVNWDYFASNKQQKCIIISNLALFWVKLNKMCKFFSSYEESLHLAVYKLAKYVKKKLCCFLEKNTQLKKLLDDRRSLRSRQISSLHETA